MIIQIASDLHIEYYDDINITDFIEPVDNVDILILAGDIGNLYKYDQLFNFLLEICNKFKIVIYVPGNNEFYTQKNIKPIRYIQLQKYFIDLENSISNLYILNRSYLIIGEYMFLGCILWSYIPQDKKYPYFRVRIEGMNKYYYNLNHRRDVHFISNMIKYAEDNDYKLIVITHYPPSLKCLSMRRIKDKYNYLYATDLENLLNDHNINLWICGHVHWNFEFQFGNTKLISNQKGKIKDKNAEFSTKYFLEIV